jgi:hypothetical protein
VIPQDQQGLVPGLVIDWDEIPSPKQSAGEGRQRRIEAHQLQTLQLSLGRQQPIEGIPVGLPVATGVDAVMQLDDQRLETLLLQQRRQILKQPFGARKFAEATFGGELPAGGGTHKDRGRWIVDGR